MKTRAVKDLSTKRRTGVFLQQHGTDRTWLQSVTFRLCDLIGADTASCAAVALCMGLALRACAVRGSPDLAQEPTEGLLLF